jgi:nucleoside-diphosphate-sugar epimerase
LPNYVPKDENEIIKPAVNGTINVLKACVQEGTKVKRVVLTSSCAAIKGDGVEERHDLYTENDWPKLDGLLPYTKSKVLAERAGKAKLN